MHTVLREVRGLLPSIIAIKINSPNTIFYFSNISSETVYKYITDLKKGSIDTPLKIVKSNADIITPFLTSCINSSFKNNSFPDELKLADIIPIHKKGDSNDKRNYRPISILPTISKVFERAIYEQISIFFNDKLSKLLCGCRKGFSTQHTLMRLLQKWQKCLDNKGIIGTILMDLSKAYDCINYDILLAKLELLSYGFSYNSLAFLSSYLKKRIQRTKVGSIFCKWLKVVLGIPQGSILGPLLFNIFINDLFEFVLDTDICKFADDNTLYACDISLEAVINRLNLDTERINNWFANNSMVANPGKFQLMYLGTNENRSIFIDNMEIKPQDEVELLGLKIDKKQNFRSHINHICNKANSKISQLIILRKNMSTRQAKIIVNTYILPYFLYCPLIWMFCRKKEINLINKVHKRALKTIYNDSPSSSFEELLLLDNSICFHKRHLQLLMLEVFKSVRHDNPLLLE